MMVLFICIPKAKVEEVAVKKNVRKKDVEYDIGHVQTQTKDVTVTIFSVGEAFIFRLNISCNFLY